MSRVRIPTVTQLIFQALDAKQDTCIACITISQLDCKILHHV